MARLPAGTLSESYDVDVAIVRTRLQWGLSVIGLALLFILPLFISSDRSLILLNTIGITIITVHGLNILTGYCGQINLGQVGFMAVGGYTSAILAIQFGLPFWVCLPLAGLTAALVGVIFGLPALRVKGFYLALATLAAQFIIL
ncbi:MAG: branched-chain amino acid ABC transporter permease, partial [Chloroflexi bacterium CG07_land_8_20_14_0_80_51_10]